MKLRYSLAAALLFALPAAPAAAEAELYAETDTFIVLRDAEDRTCGLIQMWDHPEFGETTLMLYDEAATDGTLTFIFGAENTGMPKDGGAVTLQMDFVSDDADDASGDWGKRSFTVLPEDEGEHTFYTVLAGADRERLLNDLGSYVAVGFHHDGRLLAAMPLDGAAQSVASLRQCLKTFS